MQAVKEKIQRLDEIEKRLRVMKAHAELAADRSTLDSERLELNIEVQRLKAEIELLQVKIEVDYKS